MECHYCDRAAAYAADHDGVRVGLCERDFEEQIGALAESSELAAVRDRIDVERP